MEAIPGTNTRELLVFDKNFEFSFPLSVSTRKFHITIIYGRNQDST